MLRITYRLSALMTGTKSLNLTAHISVMKKYSDTLQIELQAKAILRLFQVMRVCTVQLKPTTKKR